MKTKKALKAGPGPLPEDGSMVTIAIKTNGVLIRDYYLVHSIRVERKANSISRATIIIMEDGEMDGLMPASSSEDFIPRAEIEIAAGYGGRNSVIFTGIVTGHSLRIEPRVGPVLELECQDRAVAMNIGKKNRVFADHTDADNMTAIIGSYAKLTSDVAATDIHFLNQVQVNCTDWEYVLARAAANKMIVTTLDSKVAVKKVPMEDFPASVLSVTYGVDLIAFNATWTEWEESDRIKTNHSGVRGKAKFQGSGLVKPGDFMDFNGVGTRFNGARIVSGVTHILSEGNWFTEVTIGLAPQTSEEVPAEAYAGIIPVAKGLYNGKVKKSFNDPDGQYRVLVEVPLLDEFKAGIWARLSNFYATEGAGAFFLPEVDDEVVMGFLNEDPHFPIILGSMYSTPSRRPSAELTPAEGNSVKGIVSRSGMGVYFDDENKELSFLSPAYNSIVISDKEKLVSIKDQHSNSIVMSADGISINSAKDINIAAAGNINIGSTGRTSVTAKQDVAITGMNVNQTAQVGFTAKGSATAEVSSSGQTTIKGGMVMIN